MSLFELARAVLARPGEVRHVEQGAPTARLLLVGLIGAAIFGAVVGGRFHAVQVLWGALKMPAVLLLPVLVSLPTLHRLLRAGDEDRSWTSLTREGALLVARVGALLVVAAPGVWVLWNMGIGHASAVRVAALVTGGMAALGLRGMFLVGGEGLLGLRTMVFCLFALTLGQSAWMLRPFIGRPCDEPIFLEPTGGTFLHGLILPDARNGMERCPPVTRALSSGGPTDSLGGVYP